jgi:hypothetical protein
MCGEKSRAPVNHKAQEGASGVEKSQALVHTGCETLVGMRKLD